METLGAFLARCPEAKGQWNETFLQRCMDLPYNFDRKAYPRWYLTGAEYKVMVRKVQLWGKLPTAFTYNRISHKVVALYDCKQEIAALIGNG